MIGRLFGEQEGQTLVEYGMLVSLIAVAVIAILAVLGRKARDLYVQVNTQLTSTS